MCPEHIANYDQMHLGNSKIDWTGNTRKKTPGIFFIQKSESHNVLHTDRVTIRLAKVTARCRNRLADRWPHLIYLHQESSVQAKCVAKA